jgi:hypothetical protein
VAGLNPAIPVFGQADAQKRKRKHRPQKLVAGLNPAIPVFGQADAQKAMRRKPMRKNQ